MVLLDELRVTMSDYQKDMDELYEVLGVAAATERYNVLQEEIAKEGFWDDLEHSQKVLQESKTLENRINSYKKMQSELEDIITLIELSLEEGETESTPDMNAECDAFIKKLEEMKLASLLTGEYDHSNAILTFHAGAGGTEAQDWAEMLYRMYNKWAQAHGMEYVVTGHYARVEQDPDTGRWLLKKGLDEGKDQSYVLYNLTQEQLAHVRLPLGGLHKAEVREIAEKQHFINARKHDSQDICFVPDGDYARFMEDFTGKHYPAGDFLDENGKKVGTHNGAVRYTIGQRKGLGLAMGAPVYVCAKDMQANTVTVGPEENLFDRIVYADEVNWIAIPELTAPLRVTARTRYHQPERPATATLLPDGRVRVDFAAPQRAIAPGQAVVLYNGESVIGGGTILNVE